MIHVSEAVDGSTIDVETVQGMVMNALVPLIGVVVLAGFAIYLAYVSTHSGIAPRKRVRTSRAESRDEAETDPRGRS